MYWLQKRMLAIPTLSAADPALTLTYRYWNDIREDGFLPARCRFDTPQFRLVVPDAHWIDMAELGAGDPPDFGQLNGFATAVAARLGHPRQPAQLGDALTEDLRLTTFTACPLFQLLQLSVCDNPFFYQVLMMPFADDGAKVREILLLAREGQLELADSDLDEIG